MLALNPLGGSLVTLTEFCRTATGKHLEGIELMNNLKALLSFGAFSAISNTMRSMESIQEVARWQFFNNSSESMGSDGFAGKYLQKNPIPSFQGAMNQTLGHRPLSLA